jgi:hypothetical protein
VTSEDAFDANVLVQALVGEILIQLCVGVGDTQLRFTGDAVLAMESPVRVDGTGNAAPFELDGLALLLPLLNGAVSAVEVSDPGNISLTIGGTTVRCLSDPAFEAWNYTASAGERVVSMPGGALAVWPAR